MISSYLIAGAIIALALFLVGVILVWFAGLFAAVWMAVRHAKEWIYRNGKGERIAEVVLIAAALTADPPAPRVQWVIVSADFCEPCRKLKADLKLNLRKVGWSVSSDKSAQVRFVDYTEGPEVAVYPTLILMRDGVERERHEGVLSAKDMARRYNAEVERMNRGVK